MSTTKPDESTLKELAAASIRLARGAGDVLRRYQSGSIHVDYKGKEATDPVTEADRRVEEYLQGEISREFPDHGIVAEESAETAGAEDADFMWALDPVDGTANFAAGVPFYAVSIGLLYRGVPVVGSLHLPSTFAGDGVYHARVGGGAYAEDTPLKVSDSPFPQPSRLSGVPAGYGRAFSMKREKGRGLGEVRVMGSIACEMVLVAKGVFQSSLFTGSHIWDVAAGMVLIQEAGGVVMEWRRGRWKPFREFVAPSEKSGEGRAQALRRWGAPLLTGGPDVAAYLASRMRLRRRTLGSFLRGLRLSMAGTNRRPPKGLV